MSLSDLTIDTWAAESVLRTCFRFALVWYENADYISDK